MIFYLSLTNSILGLICFITVIFFLIKGIKLKYLSIFFTIFIFTDGITDILSFLLAILKGNNLFLYHFYFPLQFIFLVLTFIYWLPESKRKILQVIAYVTFIVVVIDQMLSDFNSLNMRAVSVQSIVCLAISLRYLLWHTEFISNSTENRPQLFIVLGVVLYSAATSVAFTIFTKINSPLPMMIISMVNIISYLFYLIAFLYFYKSTRGLIGRE